MIPQIGYSIEHYELVAKLGTGSAGEVYRAQDKKLNRSVAIKLLSSPEAASSDLRQRFVQEAKAASALNHPNILTIFEAGHFDGLDYIVMEYIEGQNLRTRLNKGKLPLPILLNVAIQICTALESAHAAHIIHRDIKPDNIMVRKDGLVKLLDFGIAKIRDNQNQPMMSTQPGTLLGTIGYMSPEQAQCEATDGRADIFSTGAVLYEMALGVAPFYSENHIDTLYAILKSDPPAFKPNDGIPPALEQIIFKALAKDPAARFQSAKEMGTALRRLSKLTEFAQVLQQVEPQVQPEIHQAINNTPMSSQVFNVESIMGSRELIPAKPSLLPWLLVGVLTVIVIIETVIIIYK